MAIQLSGLGGFDSSSVVTQLSAIAQQPVDDLSSKKSLVDSASVTFNSYNTKLATLKSAATALSTTTGFVSMAATSSDTSIVSSATGSPAAGSYTVNVTQLAAAQKTRSDAQTSSTTALGQSGTLSLKIGTGDPLNIDVASTDTLTDIAAKINRSGGRVTAGIINAGGSYRLSLQGLDTGADNAISVTEGGSISLGLSNPLNTIQKAQDAKLTVDGLDITSKTNSVADAIPGLTMALTKTTATPATLTVATDSTSLKAKIASFVSAYNDVVAQTHSSTGYGTSKASNSVLAGDYAMRKALDKLSSMVTGQVSGATGNYKSLFSVGLSVATDGTMSLDSDKLDAALSKDPNSVQRLFVTDTSSGATGIMKGLADTITSFTGTNGLVSARMAALAQQSKDMATSITSKQTAVDAYTAGLKTQFAALDQAMAKYNAMSSSLSAIATIS